MTVIDFVGNHRVFLVRLRTLLSLGSADPAGQLQALLSGEVSVLPDGCAVEVSLEAKQTLEALLMAGGADEVGTAWSTEDGEGT